LDLVPVVEAAAAQGIAGLRREAARVGTAEQVVVAEAAVVVCRLVVELV